ncbi:sugar ABC transporter substrate-binding protein [Timonella senegalensis]|uniref:sugar ABC transporter substrate-binding protein n=1 Tax=Timonella senegalensis TaxID=1465825 RepID=UPI0002E7495B|nr:maltose ABC transporter substrate-binding protein [Timonella senegalensis]
MQRGIPAVAAALGMALVLSACSGGTTPETESPKPTTSESEAPEVSGKLTVWVDETRINDFKDVVAKFKADRGVEVEVVQKASGDIRTEFVQQVPTGEGPDVIIGANDWIGEFVTNGVVAPIELGDKAAQFSAGSINAFSYEGKSYGVPYAVESIGLVRNNALAKETPATFDELIAQGKELKSEFPVLIQQGDQGDAYHLYPLQTSFGSFVFKQDEAGNYTDELALGGAQGEAWAKYLAKLGKEGILDASIGGDQAKEAFSAGKSAYMVTGPWYASEFVKEGMDISILPIPSAGGEESRPFAGYQGAYISAKSQNALLANDFVVNYLSTEEAADQIYASGGRIPALTASAAKITDEIAKGWADAAANGLPQPGSAAMGVVWGFWGAAQLDIASGKAADPVKAWETMVKNIEDGIKKG